MSLISNNNYDSNYNNIEEIISRGIDINYNDDYFLIASTFNNNPRTVQLLLDSGCNNKKNYDRALISAIYNNQNEVIKVLLKNGANVNDDEALRFCSLKNNINMLKILLDYGADHDKLFKNFIYQNNLDISKYLLSYGIDVNKYKILLDICLISKNDDYYDAVKLLLENGVDLKNHNTNPISWCIRKNNIRIIKLFIENGIDIDNECLKICSEVNDNDSHFEIIKNFYDQGVNFDYIIFNSNNVETLKYINQIIMLINFRYSELCPITLESLEDKEKLGCINCFNVFKKDALIEWLKFNNVCPLCKKCSRYQKA